MSRGFWTKEWFDVGLFDVSRRHFDVITSKWCRFDVITTLSLCHVFRGTKQEKRERISPCWTTWKVISLSNAASTKLCKMFEYYVFATILINSSFLFITVGHIDSFHIRIVANATRVIRFRHNDLTQEMDREHKHITSYSYLQNSHFLGKTCKYQLEYSLLCQWPWRVRWGCETDISWWFTCANERVRQTPPV